VNKSDEQTIMWLAGLWLLSKYSWEVAPALQRGGARVYDWLHNDEGHKQDLPGHQLTRQAVLEIATRTGFPNPKLASAIAFAESGGVPGAFVRSSREYSVGLWQINTMAHPYSVADMKDPLKNAQAAFMISRGGTDWTPWTMYRNGKYRLFLTGVFA
jgi:Lysozyme like domain